MGAFEFKGARYALPFQALFFVLLVVAQAELDFTTDQNGMTHASKEAVMHYIRVRGHSNALTRPLSLHGCRRDQLPAHLTSAAAATEPADFLMTAASWYSPYKTRTFLRTFRKHNQAARILMFVDPIQWADTRDAYCEYGRHYDVEFHSIEPNSFYPLVLLRFRAFYEVLILLSTDMRNVLMVDVRDTLFQGDPFSPEWLPAPKTPQPQPHDALPYVLFTEEGTDDAPFLIENHEPNRRWVENCFNATVVDAIKHNPVKCAGTILAGRGAALAYMQLALDVALFTAKETCMQYSLDQGIHNYLAYWLLPRHPELFAFEVLPVANEASPIYTLGQVDAARIEAGEGGFAVYNRRGKRPPVLHQWDRRPQLADYMVAYQSEDPVEAARSLV